MPKHVISFCLALMMTILSVIAPAHAAGMVAAEVAPSHSMMGADQASAMDCCPEKPSVADHRALCAFACAANFNLGPALPGPEFTLAKPPEFPLQASLVLKGQSPTLPERPPKSGLLSA